VAKGVVGKGNAAVAVAEHDQVALRFEQAAGAFLGFLQFPIAIDKSFVVHRDLAKFLFDEAQPHAEKSKRQAGECKQKTRADRERIRIVT
jgi:hypothetical protein